jgi:hypothetical protein
MKQISGGGCLREELQLAASEVPPFHAGRAFRMRVALA